MTSPAAGVDFDRNRIGQGELIAGVAGLVLLIDLWFKWYGVKLSGSGGGLLKSLNIRTSASFSAWEVFSLIDILLFLVALVAIGVAVMRGLNRMPEMPYPPSTLVAGAGGLAVVLILFRLLSTPIDTGGASGVDVTRKFGVFLGLIAAAGVVYGGWRAMQEAGTSFSAVTGGGAAGGTAPTTPMPAGAEPAAAPPAAADPIPGETAPETPPGLAGDPGADTGTTPPGIAGDRTPGEGES